MYNIYAALKGHHSIDHFGFNLPKKTKSILTTDYRKSKFILQYSDWVCGDYESTLTAYIPDAGLESILVNHIDTVLD